MGENTQNQKIDPANQLNVTFNAIKNIAEEYSLIDFDYEILTDGIDNTSVLISTKEKKYVLRIYRRLKKTNEDISLEIQFQKMLKGHSLPIPEVIPNIRGEDLTTIVVDEREWQIVLMEYMGKTDFKKYTPELLNEMAVTQAKMHKLGIEFAVGKTHSRIKSELKERISKDHPTKITDKKLRDFMQRATSFYLALDKNLPYGYNHLDYDPQGNILIKDNKISAILDFDDLAYSPCVVCLGYTLWGILFWSNETDFVYRYVKAYKTSRSLNKEEIAILPKVMQFRNYAVGAIELTVRKRDTYMEQILHTEQVISKMVFSKKNKIQTYIFQFLAHHRYERRIYKKNHSTKGRCRQKMARRSTRNY